MNKIITLKNDASLTIRLLQKDDEERLFNYFSQLSAESKSRFGPHLFDRDTVRYIVNEQGSDIFRYVALDEEQEIVAYMLIKNGMLEGEQYRLRENNIAFEKSLYCTYAPSVADTWQSSGHYKIQRNFSG